MTTTHHTSDRGKPIRVTSVICHALYPCEDCGIPVECPANAPVTEDGRVLAPKDDRHPLCKDCLAEHQRKKAAHQREAAAAARRK